MASLLPWLNLKNLAFRSVSIWTATAVVLVFLGPAFDHHYVERQHHHSHIYLNSNGSEHWHPESHPFEEHHSHSNVGTESKGHHTVIYQASNDGIGDSSTSFTMALINDSSLQVQGGDSSNRLQTDTNLDEISVTPLKRPPRA